MTQPHFANQGNFRPTPPSRPFPVHPLDYSGILNKLQQLSQAPGTNINPDFLTRWSQNWTDHWGRINELRSRFGHPPIPIPPMPGVKPKMPKPDNGQRGPLDPANGRGTYYPKDGGVVGPNGIPTQTAPAAPVVPPMPTVPVPQITPPAPPPTPYVGWGYS